MPDIYELLTFKLFYSALTGCSCLIFIYFFSLVFDDADVSYLLHSILKLLRVYIDLEIEIYQS